MQSVLMLMSTQESIRSALCSKNNKQPKKLGRTLGTKFVNSDFNDCCLYLT